MKELHSKMEKASGKGEAQCETCSDGGHMTAFCHQCRSFICRECVSSHQKMKVFVEHTVTTLEKLKPTGAYQIILRAKTVSSPPPHCSIHDKKIKLYCFNCDRLICRDCIIVDHAGHKCDFIKKMAPKMKNTLTNCIAPLKHRNLKLREAIVGINGSRDNVKAQRTLLTNEVDQAFQELHKILEERKEELLSEIESIADYKLEQLSTQEKALSTSSTTIKSIVDLVEQSCENSTNDEVLSIHQQLLNRIDEVTSNHLSVRGELEPVEEADMNIKVDCSCSLYKLCQTNASVSTGVKNYTVKLNRSGSVSSDEVHKTAVILMEIYGWLANGKQAKKVEVSEIAIAAELISKVDGSAVTITTRQRADQMYELEYIPQVRGRHELTISIDNQQVTGSPFPVFVNIPPTQLCKPVGTVTGLANPWGIALNLDGEMIITEYNGDIVKINSSGGKVAFIKQTEYDFRSITGIAIDEENSVYVAQCSAAGKLFKFDKNGQLLQDITAKELKQPRGIRISGDYLIVCGYDRIQIYTRDLKLSRQFGVRGSGLGEIREARNVAVDEDGCLYVCDSKNDRIQVFDSQGEFEHIFCKIHHPRDLVIFNNQIYISSETGNHSSVSIYLKNGKFVGSFGNQGDFSQPFGIIVDGDGFIHVCDFGNSRLLKY